MFLQTIYYPLQLFAKNVRGNSLNLTSMARPTRRNARRRSLPRRLGVVDGNTLVLNVVNRHQDQAIDATIEFDDQAFAARWGRRSQRARHQDRNDFGKSEVRTESRTARAQGKTAQYLFPPHSFTQLKAQLA